jgi:hypothetical protein
MSNLITKPLSEMTYKEMEEIKLFVNSPKWQFRERELWMERVKEIDAEARKNRETREKSKEKLEREVFPALKKYAQNYLFKDDIVKFQGANSGGFRQILRIDENSIFCLVVRWDRTKKTWEPTGYSSDNSIEKLSEVYLTSLDNANPMPQKYWFNRKAIVEFINKQK